MEFRRHVAIKKARKFVEEFNDVIERANLVGGLVRNPRRHAYVKDIDILVIAKHKIYHGPPLDLFYTTEKEWEAAVLYLSIGMKVIKLSLAAKYKKLKFTRHGLYTRHRIPKLISTSACEICDILGVPMPDPAKQVLEKQIGKLK